MRTGRLTPPSLTSRYRLIIPARQADCMLKAKIGSINGLHITQILHVLLLLLSLLLLIGVGVIVVIVALAVVVVVIMIDDNSNCNWFGWYYRLLFDTTKFDNIFLFLICCSFPHFWHKFMVGWERGGAQIPIVCQLPSAWKIYLQIRGT